MRSRPWASRWLVVVVSGVVLAASVATTAQKPAQTEPAPPAPMTMDALLASLPVTRAPGFDEARAQWLVAQPFACLDELQPRPGNRPYFWEATFRPVDNYDKVRAFYGCGDWHSAVNATWTLTVVLKRMPEISVGRLIREKLTDHLGKTNLDGEVAFFKDAGTFERPYGYAWLLTLGAELQTWDDTQAAQWAANLAPLSKYFSEQIIAYLKMSIGPSVRAVRRTRRSSSRSRSMRARRCTTTRSGPPSSTTRRSGSRRTSTARRTRSRRRAIWSRRA